MGRKEMGKWKPEVLSLGRKEMGTGNVGSLLLLSLGRKEMGQ